MIPIHTSKRPAFKMMVLLVSIVDEPSHQPNSWPILHYRHRRTTRSSQYDQYSFQRNTHYRWSSLHTVRKLIRGHE